MTISSIHSILLSMNGDGVDPFYRTRDLIRGLNVEITPPDLTTESIENVDPCKRNQGATLRFARNRAEDHIYIQVDPSPAAKAVINSWFLSCTVNYAGKEFKIPRIDLDINGNSLYAHCLILTSDFVISHNCGNLKLKFDLFREDDDFTKVPVEGDAPTRSMQQRWHSAT